MLTVTWEIGTLGGGTLRYSLRNECAVGAQSRLFFMMDRIKQGLFSGNLRHLFGILEMKSLPEAER